MPKLQPKAEKGEGCPIMDSGQKRATRKEAGEKKRTHKTAESEGQTTKLLNAKPTPWQHKSSTN
jgi:hypothetical protein